MENNQKTAIQEMDETAKRRKDEKLAEAIKIVNAEIRVLRDEYEKIAHTEEQDPIMVEGETTKGYPVHTMVDPKEIAKIFLWYDYATIRVLGEDAPDNMWKSIADLVGLDTVYGVDL